MGRMAAALSSSQGNPLGAERRRGGQVRVPFRVPISTEPIDAPLSFWGHTENISAGGLCVLQDATLPAGTCIRLTLRLRRHLLLSTVIWTQPLLGELACRVGIAFQHPLSAAIIADLAAGRY